MDIRELTKIIIQEKMIIHFKNIPVRNSYESLYVYDTQELEILVNRSTETQRRKPRSNRINKISSRNEKSYNYRNSTDESNNTIHNDYNNNDNNVNARQKVVRVIGHMLVPPNMGKKPL